MAKAKIIANVFGSVGSQVNLLAGPEPVADDFEEKVINLQEVSWHDTRKDCWIIVYDRVYAITEFLDEHPGGDDILLEYAGRDASIAFRGTGHSAQAIRALDKYFVGELPMHERIFRKPGGIKLSGIPL